MTEIKYIEDINAVFCKREGIISIQDRRESLDLVIELAESKNSKHLIFDLSNETKSKNDLIKDQFKFAKYMIRSLRGYKLAVIYTYKNDYEAMRMVLIAKFGPGIRFFKNLDDAKKWFID